MKFPVFDLHCDTADKLLAGAEMNKNNEHIDLQRASTLPGYAQCFACFTTTGGKYNPVDVFEKKLALLMSELMKNSDKMTQVFDAEGIEANRENGIMSAILTIEGPAGFGFDPALLDDLYKIGFRITTLGWNEDNPLTGSHITGGGLKKLGREYVREAQRLGMIVDVSHISDAGFWDIMEITNAPVIASHSNSRAVWDNSRNLTDEMFRAICKTGGVVGVNLYPAFLGENASVETVCRHVLHFASMDPECAHIALGGDLDGIETTPADFAGVQDYPKLADALLRNGLTDDQVHRIFWDNALGVIKRCCT